MHEMNTPPPTVALALASIVSPAVLSFARWVCRCRLGKDPTVINLGGFEAAMVGRLREAKTLPVLPKGCDDLLFGASAEDRRGEVSFGQGWTRFFWCSSLRDSRKKKRG